jgi:hypothetical protein
LLDTCLHVRYLLYVFILGRAAENYVAWRQETDKSKQFNLTASIRVSRLPLIFEKVDVS